MKRILLSQGKLLCLADIWRQTPCSPLQQQRPAADPHSRQEALAQGFVSPQKRSASMRDRLRMIGADGAQEKGFDPYDLPGSAVIFRYSRYRAGVWASSSFSAAE